MGKIVLLDDLTINQIAAGEVIERPASVVKELVENSIDAGATSVVIEIKKGGKALIKVSDNGSGIMMDDMVIAFERHATSKIRCIDDLESTYTMGFRGEALASICSISNFTMITKTEDADVGTKIIARGGEILSSEEVVAQKGTTMIVEELFYNTPVRYKFLKQDSTEFRYIKELLQKIALSNLNVAIKLINDGKPVFQTNGSGNIRDAIYVIFGKELRDNLVDVNYSDETIKINGVIGNTMIAKDSRKSQLVFLNNRNVKNSVLSNSADQAFKSSIGIGKFAFFILNISMPASEYDINVHPTKLDVRFKNEEKIYKAFYYAIKSAMLNTEFLTDNKVEEKKENYIEKEFNFVTNHFEKNQTTEVFKSAINKNFSLINRESERKVEYKYIGILFKTFIAIEIENELYFIDQHAAHERVMYEKVRDNYKNQVMNNTQMTLIPEVIELSHKECEFVKNNLELFKNTGFDVEFFGSNSVKINGIPDLEYKSNCKNLFMDILDEMITNERGNVKEVEERFIATVACKAAVKANMVLTESEAKELIDTLLKLKNPYTCAHGRPTNIKLSKAEIIKKLT